MVVRLAGAYVGSFQQAVLDFLAFTPAYVTLAEKLAKAVTLHATPVGSGTVARTGRAPIFILFGGVAFGYTTRGPVREANHSGPGQAE